ncbi:MAG: HEAT repeat domain-containing protein [Planctomycetota bacterium]|jgi:HEAT repeat protein
MKHPTVFVVILAFIAGPAFDVSSARGAEPAFPGYAKLRAEAEKLWPGRPRGRGAALILVPPGSALKPAAEKLAVYRNASILEWSPRAPEDSLRTLIEKNARYVTLFVEPEDMDVNLVRRFVVLSTLIDEDPFCDFAFGFVTASSPDKAIAFVERIIEADGKGVDPSALSFCTSNISRKYPGSSFIEGMRGDAIYVSLGNMAFAKKSLNELQEPGFIHIGGCGDPEGVWMFADKRNLDRSKHWPYDPARVGEDPDGEMPRLLASDFAKLKLKNPVVWTHVCHIGSVSRVFVEGDIVSTFGRCEKVEAYTIPKGRSVALALIEAGVSAYIAPLGPNFGAQSDIEQAAASELGLPLGDVMRRAYHDVVMDTGGHPEQIGVYVEGKPAMWDPDGFTNYNSPHNRALYGDPQFKPFGAFRSPATVKVVAEVAEDRAVLRFELASSGYLGRTWYGNRGRSNKGRGRIYEVVELPEAPKALTVGEVTALDGSGEPFEITSKTVLLEEIDSKTYLHIQLVTDSAEALRRLGAKVEAVVHFALAPEKKGPSELAKALDTEWDLGKREWVLRDLLKTVRDHLSRNRNRFDWGRIAFVFAAEAAGAQDEKVWVDMRNVKLRDGLLAVCRKLGLKTAVDTEKGTVTFMRRPVGELPPPVAGKRFEPEWGPEPAPQGRGTSKELKKLLFEYKTARADSISAASTILTRIGKLRTAEAAKALKALYRREKEYLVIRETVKALKEVGGGPCAEVLLELLRRERNQQNRKLLRGALRSLRARSAAEVLVDEGLAHKEADIRAEAARTLGGMKWSGSVERLVELARDGKSEPRLAAIAALGDIGAPESLDVLLELARGRDEPVSIAALSALSGMGSGDSRIGETALEILSSWNSDRRIQAVVLLGRQGERGAVPVIVPLLKDSSWSLRSAAIGALGDIRHVGSILPLIERVSREKGRLLDEVAMALHRITGLDFGSDSKLWRKWWEDKGADFEVAPIVKGGLGAHKAVTMATYHDLPITSTRIVFLLDVSGSMQNEMGSRGRSTRLDYCKWELNKTILRLPKGVVFNIVTFDTLVRSWEGSVVAATKGNKKRATQFVDFHKGTGGTNMAGALKKAFKDSKADTFYLLSDGLPDGDPAALLRWLKETHATQRVVIHTIGVGDAGRGSFLKKVAHLTGGTFKPLK